MFKVLATQEIAASLGGLVVGVIFAANGAGVWALVYAFLASVVLKTVLLSRVGLARFRPSLHFQWSDLKGYIDFGLFQMGERTMNYLSERLDQILIGSLLGAQSLGFYNFAFNLAERPVSRINPILTRVAFPVFSRLQDDRDRLRRGYVELVRFITTINAPLLIGLAATAPVVVPLVFGPKWSQSIPLIQILCFVSLGRSIGNPIGSLQLAKGRADLGFWWNVLLFVISVPAIYLGSKIGGASGVALALLGLQIGLSAPVYFFLVRPLIGRCAQDYASAILKPTTVASAMGLIVVSFVAIARGLPQAVMLLAAVSLGLLVYFILLRIFHRKALVEVRSALVAH